MIKGLGGQAPKPPGNFAYDGHSYDVSAVAYNVTKRSFLIQSLKKL